MNVAGHYFDHRQEAMAVGQADERSHQLGMNVDTPELRMSRVGAYKIARAGHEPNLQREESDCDAEEM